MSEVATFAGGCFWCTEAVFQDLRGVERVVPGYAGGHTPNPSYEQVCSGATGHAEAVQVTFDPAVVSLRDLLGIFFTVHDPTTKDRQGPDVGTQYRSAFFYRDPEQRRIAEEVMGEVTDAAIWRGRIVTQLAPFTVFYEAEPYHHNYFRDHPEQAYCQAIIAPKVAKFRKRFAAQLA